MLFHICLLAFFYNKKARPTSLIVNETKSEHGHEHTKSESTMDTKNAKLFRLSRLRPRGRWRRKNTLTHIYAKHKNAGARLLCAYLQKHRCMTNAHLNT